MHHPKPKAETIAAKAARYAALSEQIKALSAEKDRLSASLKESAQASGSKDGDSWHLEVPGFKVSSICAVSTVPREAELARMLQSKGLLEQCTKKVIDLDKVEALSQEGKILVSELSAISDTKKSYRVSVKATSAGD